MPAFGAFTFVLHTHLPYARRAGVWPHGEEWLHEAAADTYLPMLDVLERLAAEGIDTGVTLGLTPILLEQLTDSEIRDHFRGFLAAKRQGAEDDAALFHRRGEDGLADLAAAQRDHFGWLQDQFDARHAGNLVPSFRRLSESGAIETLTSAATHGYLPLLARDEAIRLQLRAGIAAHRRHLGAWDGGLWLPECAYRPGLEHHMADAGVRSFLTESDMLERRDSRALLGASDAVPATTMRPYDVSGSGVAVVGRNRTASRQVWGAHDGYPGDFDYREFHKRHTQTGLHYWRITGAGVPLDNKEPYDPRRASQRARIQAGHFTDLVVGLLRRFRDQTGEYGLVAAVFDTELFGHWWAEGIEWLEQVLRQMSSRQEVEVTTVGRYLDRHPPDRVIDLPEGSWGDGGDHRVWDNPNNHWMWPILHAAEHRMARVAGEAPRESLVMKQAARELLLLQSSDWPFLITTGQAAEYADQRFREHAARFDRLLDGVEAGSPDEALAKSLYEQDKVFPDLEVGWFAR